MYLVCVEILYFFGKLQIIIHCVSSPERSPEEVRPKVSTSLALSLTFNQMLMSRKRCQGPRSQLHSFHMARE